MKKEFFIFGLIILLLICEISAIDTSRQDRLDFGYVLNVINASTIPVNLVPGSSGVIRLVIENRANFPIYDIRLQLSLPSQVSFLDDVTKRKG